MFFRGGFALVPPFPFLAGSAKSSLSPPHASSTAHHLASPVDTGSSTIKERDKSEREQDYERRRKLWLDRYGSVEALESTFSDIGKSSLSPEQTRQLYHSLLPRSLLGLYEMELMKPEELAPLAYEARIAAKQYARSRCVWYGRLWTSLFDQYRNLRSRGRFSKQSSMSWEEVWSKYEAQIVEEECMKDLNATNGKKLQMCKANLNEEDLTMRIYLRILERSVVTNEAWDKAFLKQKQSNRGAQVNQQLQAMANQLDKDVLTILLEPKDASKFQKTMEKGRLKAREKKEKNERELAKTAKKLQRQKYYEEKERLKAEYDAEKERLKANKQAAKKEQKQLEKTSRKQKENKDADADGDKSTIAEDEGTTSSNGGDVNAAAVLNTPSVRRLRVLRILANTRKRLSIKKKKEFHFVEND